MAAIDRFCSCTTAGASLHWTTAARIWVFPLERGSVEDGILTCHWHHARFELGSGCTFDLWADDVPTCPVEIRAGGEIWVKPVFGYPDPVKHWHRRLEDGLGHNLSLVIAKAAYRGRGDSPHPR